jgi:8-oxo-dGTP pyrophosphatase MutT (NUDIX family)
MDKQLIRKALAAHAKTRATLGNLSPAAVVVPLYCETDECHVVFARRSQNVTFHKGQFCFPGGRPNHGETDLLSTALRESHEEVGLKPQDIEILGELDDQMTTSGYVVTPFVGYIRHPYDLMSDGCEVEEIITVPFSYLAEPGNWRHQPPPDVKDHSPTYSIEYNGRIIWGATARILWQLVQLLKTHDGAPQHP